MLSVLTLLKLARTAQATYKVALEPVLSGHPRLNVYREKIIGHLEMDSSLIQNRFCFTKSQVYELPYIIIVSDHKPGQITACKTTSLDKILTMHFQVQNSRT